MLVDEQAALRLAHGPGRLAEPPPHARDSPERLADARRRAARLRLPPGQVLQLLVLAFRLRIRFAGLLS